MPAAATPLSLCPAYHGVGAQSGEHQLCPHRDLFPQSYLHKFAYKNTVYLDLWDHLQEVGDSLSRKAIWLGS